jgi:hypothetical protein
MTELLGGGAAASALLERSSRYAATAPLPRGGASGAAQPQITTPAPPQRDRGPSVGA